MAIIKRKYQFELEAVAGYNTVGTISDLLSLSVSNSTILVDIIGYAQAAAGGLSGFTEFSNFNVRQLVIKNTGGTLTISNSEQLYIISNISGTTDIIWTDSLSGSDLVIDAESLGIQQSIFLTVLITLEN